MDRRDRWARNPFYVLGLAPDSARGEVERSVQKLHGLLGVGASAAKRCDTPFGPRPRTEDDVRAAAAELRDPAKRLVHELWAQPFPDAPAEPAAPAWPDALAAVGLAPKGAKA